MIRPATSATAANTTALAANSVPRRGIAVSDVRIIPVAYSEVMVSTPSTAMTSWPKYRPNELRWVGSKPGPSCFTLWAAPALASAPKPIVMTTRASSVQYVDLVDLILVNSDRTEPMKPARPDGRGSGAAPEWRPATGADVVAISGHLSRVHRMLALLARERRRGTARWRRSVP